MKAIYLTALIGLNTLTLLAQTIAQPSSNHPAWTKVPARSHHAALATNRTVIPAAAIRSGRVAAHNTVAERDLHHKVVRWSAV